MGKKTAGLPEDTTLVRLVVASIGHGEDQLRAARALLDIGYWPGALATGTLALEELGKANLCLVGLMGPADDPDLAAQFGKIFNGHASKLAIARMVIDMFVDDEPPTSLDEVFNGLEPWARKANDSKFRALYVDYATDGSLSAPSSTTEADARWMVSQASRLLESMRGFIELPMDRVEDFVAILRQWRDSIDHTAVHALMEQSPELFIGPVRDAVRSDREPPEPLRSLILGSLKDVAPLPAAVAEPPTP